MYSPFPEGILYAVLRTRRLAGSVKPDGRAWLLSSQYFAIYGCCFTVDRRPVHPKGSSGFTLKMMDVRTGHSSIFIGCAGWSIPAEHAERFPEVGAHLERYSGRFPAVEINSCFYKSHRPATYARWAAAVPEGFRFACKLPREITHTRRLKDCVELLDRFLEETGALGVKRGPVLVQLPPSFAFGPELVSRFFTVFRQRFDGGIVCEPRHVTWFSPEAEQLLVEFRVARVAADPALHPGASEPGGWSGLVYYRLHGSPRVYYSAYSDEFLETLSLNLRTAAQTVPTWCIFDNTASGAATGDGLKVMEQVGGRRQRL